MPIRNGHQYIEGLRKRPREVWIDGARVEDVTGHPALRRPLHRIAHLYDMQFDPAFREILSHSPAAFGTSFMIPRAYEDLANQIEEAVESDCKDANAFAIIIEGDSMETKFYAGDRVVYGFRGLVQGRL